MSATHDAANIGHCAIWQVRESGLSSVDLNPSPLPSVSTGVLQQQQDSLERAAARLDENAIRTQSQSVENRIGKYYFDS